MTLIISLACKDGVVMASDGQLTLGSSGSPIRQTCIKIKRIGESILWGGSGTVGIIQKIEQNINSFPSELKKGNFDNLQPQTINLIHQIRKKSLLDYRALYGDDGYEKTPNAVTLFGSFVNGKPKIIHISEDADDTEVQDFGYGAIGIGDTFAHTILKNYNINNLSIEEGKVLAYKVIKDAIDVGAFGLGEPINIWVIREVNGEGKKRIKALEIKQEEMRGIDDTYTSIKEAENEIFKKLCGKVV